MTEQLPAKELSKSKFSQLKEHIITAPLTDVLNRPYIDRTFQFQAEVRVYAPQYMVDSSPFSSKQSEQEIMTSTAENAINFLTFVRRGLVMWRRREDGRTEQVESRIERDSESVQQETELLARLEQSRGVAILYVHGGYGDEHIWNAYFSPENSDFAPMQEGVNYLARLLPENFDHMLVYACQNWKRAPSELTHPRFNLLHPHGGFYGPTSGSNIYYWDAKTSEKKIYGGFKYQEMKTT